MQTIFITGGTRLIKALLKEGNYHIKALARKGSEQKLPQGCEVIEVPQMIYVSVCQFPSNIMKDYQAVRAEGESLLQSTGAQCSFVRPEFLILRIQP